MGYNNLAQIPKWNVRNLSGTLDVHKSILNIGQQANDVDAI